MGAENENISWETSSAVRRATRRRINWSASP